MLPVARTLYNTALLHKRRAQCANRVQQLGLCTNRDAEGNNLVTYSASPNPSYADTTIHAHSSRHCVALWGRQVHAHTIGTVPSSCLTKKQCTRCNLFYAQAQTSCSTHNAADHNVLKLNHAQTLAKHARMTSVAEFQTARVN
jgi:hypothetical protein